MLSGIFLSIIALVLLIIKAVQQDNIWMMISFPIFGVSLILLYLASTLYHVSKEPHLNQSFDHLCYLCSYRRKLHAFYIGQLKRIGLFSMVFECKRV